MNPDLDASSNPMPRSPLPSDIFAKRLRQERSRLKLSQAALASQVSALLGSNLDPTTITRIEKNERVVRLDEAVAIADALGVPLSLLVYADPISVNEEAIAAQRRALEQAQTALQESQLRVQQAALALQELATQGTGLEQATGLDDPDEVIPGRRAVLDADFAANIEGRVPR